MELEYSKLEFHVGFFFFFNPGQMIPRVKLDFGLELEFQKQSN